MDSKAHNDIDSLKKKIRDLEEKNSEMEKLLIQMREEFIKQSFTSNSSRTYDVEDFYIANRSMADEKNGASLKAESFAMEPMLTEKDQGK